MLKKIIGDDRLKMKKNKIPFFFVIMAELGGRLRDFQNSFNRVLSDIREADERQCIHYDKLIKEKTYQISGLDAENHRQTSEIKRLTDQIKRMEEAEKIYTSDTARMEKVDELTKKIEKLDLVITGLKRDKTRMTKTIEDLKNENAELSEIIEDLKR